MSRRTQACCVRLAYAVALSVIFSWVWISPLQVLAQLPSLPGSLVVTITSPTSGATVSGTRTVTASVSIVGSLVVAGVQFKLDGANLGAEDTTNPYSISWNTTTTSNGSHTLTAVARDTLGVRWTSAPVTVTVSNDTTPPALSAVTASSITSAGATITWTTNEASDSQVEYGTTTAYGQTTPVNTSLVSSHSVALSGLTAATLYHYRVKSKDAAGNLAVSGDFTFTTESGPAVENVTWTSPVNVTVTGNSIQKTSGADSSWNAGAISSQIIASGDGYVEFTFPEGAAAAGLSNGNPGATRDEIDFALKTNGFSATSIVAVWENGVLKSGTCPHTSATDVFRVAVVSGQVQYSRNGTVCATSATAPTYPLILDTSIFNLNGRVSNAVISRTSSDTTPPTISGVASSGITSSGATITWTTNEGSDSQVEYGTTTAYGSATTLDPTLVTSHSQTLSGLTANTLYHYRVKSKDGAGNLATSGDFTFATLPPPDTTPPSVSITSPLSGATVSGTVTVAAAASDNVTVAGVGFFVDGVAIGVEDTTVPYQAAWDTTTVADGSHTLTAVARDGAGNTATSAINVTVANGAPPPTVTRFEETAATLAPAGAWSVTTNADSGVTLSGDQAVFATAAGATATFTFTGTGVSWLGLRCEICGIAHVSVDGAMVATVDTFAPLPRSAEVMFTTSGLAAGSHTLVIEVTGTANASSGGTAVVVDAFDVTEAPPDGDTTPPTVAITSPASGATVSGTVTVAASASDNVAVAGVRFFVGTVEIGVEDTTAPYQAAWDTTTVADGSHTLTAVARDSAGNTTTSAPVSVTVANGAPPPPPATVTRFEETDPSVTYTAGWTQGDISRAWSGETAAVSTTAGAQATFTFTGTSVNWIGFRGPQTGIAHVFLDGVFVREVDTFSPTEEVQAVVFTATGLAAGSHTLTIEVTGRKNEASTNVFIVVDAFDVFN